MKTWQQHIEHAEASLAEATKKSLAAGHSQAVGSDVHIAVTHLKVAAFLRDQTTPFHD